MSNKLKRGESPLAQEGWEKWTGGKRPMGWRGKVYGVVGHTTGAGLPAKALDAGEEIHVRAHRHYLNSHGANYTIAYDGTIIQVANEDMQANGVGMSDQIQEVKDAGSEWWVKSFHGNATAWSRWNGRWFPHKTPLDLYPTKYANSCYVHCEMPPCVFWYNGKLYTAAAPHKPGLRFTTAQHDAFVKLSIDIADRNNFPEGWWLTGRLVGHEDLSPISRGTDTGCWDPGWLRKDPWFDFMYVKTEIEKVYKARAKAKAVLDEATEVVQKESTGPTSETVVASAFVDWIKKLLRIKW